MCDLHSVVVVAPATAVELGLEEGAGNGQDELVASDSATIGEPECDVCVGFRGVKTGQPGDEISHRGATFPPIHCGFFSYAGKNSNNVF